MNLNKKSRARKKARGMIVLNRGTAFQLGALEVSSGLILRHGTGRANGQPVKCLPAYRLPKKECDVLAGLRKGGGMRWLYVASPG